MSRPSPIEKLRVRVLIARERYAELKALLPRELASVVGRAVRLGVHEPAVRALCPGAAAAPVPLGRVNRRRKEGRLEPVPVSAIRYQRPIVKPFDPPEGDVAA